MVSEADIAEARRKALRNGEEDPVAVAQRYLNVYRQMHIFSDEKKESFDQSLLNLPPLTISIISSLPGGLTFQDYIDEVLAKAGRDKSARDNNDNDWSSSSTSSQPQILLNAQSGLQPQQVVAPIMSGPAKISLDKDFVNEFSKIMKEVILEQANTQNEGFSKIAQDIGKTQLFIAKKIDNERTGHQAEINKMCKIIAQSHTALSTSLTNLGEHITTQINRNDLLKSSLLERRSEDDMKLAKMIAQSQERIMAGLLARLPQAIGVGNVNVTTPTRSIDDDIRLAEMIAKSQEKMLSELIAKLPQPEQFIKENEKAASRRSEEDFKLANMIIQSQERILSVITEKLPQLIETKILSQGNVNTNITRTDEDDERLISLITRSQENMIRSLIDQNILSPRIYKMTNMQGSVESFDQNLQDNIYPENIENYNADDTYSNLDSSENYFNDFSVNTEVFDSSQNENIEENSNIDEVYYQTEQNINQEILPNKKKKKKKKKKTSSEKNSDNNSFILDAVEAELKNSDFDNSNDYKNIEEQVATNYDILSEIDNADKNKKDDGDKFEQINSDEIIDKSLEDVTSIDNNADIITDDNLSDVDVQKKSLEISELLDFSTESNEEVLKSEWGFYDFEDKDTSGSETQDSLVDTEQNNNQDLQQETWEYVEYEDNGEPLEEGWEYVEYEDNDKPLEEGWEYVEAINDNANIYSLDSYNQQIVSNDQILKNNRTKILLNNIPQIYDETDEEEISDPYKNSIIKD